MTGSFLSVRCPGCGATSRQVPSTLAGRTLRCAGCGARFSVPEAALAPTVPELEAAAAATVPRAGLWWRPGDVVLGLYEVAGILGEGGMGRVYRVRHRGWAMDLAVKVPLPAMLEAAGGADLFEREAETWVNLGLHPHVVTCHYVRRVNGLPLVFAELVDGGTLLEAIRARRLTSLADVLDVAIQFAWGLDHAHEQGLVHRDVKPANVMLASDGIAKVTDFGLARARSSHAEGPLVQRAGGTGQTLTVEGGGGVTPAYVSPEQARGDALTRRSDLWSFALSVLEVFLGERTWRLGLVAPEVLDAYRQAGLGAPGLPSMPPAVAELLGRCFREDPDDRPHGLGDAAAVLVQAWEEAAGRRYPRLKPRGARGSADGLNNRAVSLVDLGRGAEATALWRRALEAEPQHLEATYNASLGAWAECRIDDEEAVRRMLEACASHASKPRSQKLLGRLHLGLGKPAESLACFERARLLGLAEDHEDDVAAARAPMPGPVLSLRGLSGPVSALALAPDGGAVAAASGREVRVWDAGRGGLLRAFDIPEGPVRALAVLSEGRLLVGAEGAPLTLWDVASGRALRAWARHPGSSTCLAVLPGGRLVASGGSDRVVRLWDAEGGRCLREMQGHEDAVTSLGAGTRCVASASRDATVRLWSLEDGRDLGVLRGHSGHVQGVALDESLSRVVSAGDDRTLRDWGLNSHELVRACVSHTRSVHCLALLPGSGRVVSGSADATVRCFDLGTERLAWLVRLDGAIHALVAAGDGRVWAAHGSSVSALSPAPLRLAAAALCRPSSAVEVEERATSFEDRIEEARRSLTKGDFATALSLARTARSIPGHERAEAALSLWDDLCSRLPRKGLQSAWEEARLEGHTDQVLAVAVDAGGRWGLTGGLDSTARLWELANGRPGATLSGHQGAVMAAAFGGDGARAVTGGRDGTVRAWGVPDGRLRWTLEAHAERVAGVDVSPDGSRAASASWDGTVRLWDLARGTLARVLEGHEANVSAVRFSPDGRAVASAGWDGAVRIWHAESGEALGALLGHQGNVSAVAFHPAGRQVASGGEDRTLRLWDPKARRSLRVLTGHEAEITAVAFSPDGRFLFSSSRDQSVRVWDARRGLAVRSLPHPAAVLDLAPLPLGSRLISAGADRVARLWHLDWEPDSAEAAAPNQTARPFLEALVSRRSRGPQAPSGVPQPPAWSDAEVDGLLAELHHRGFGALTRDSVSVELRTLSSSPRAASFWDELRGGDIHAAATLPRAGAAVRRIPWGRLFAAAAVAAAFAVGFVSWYKPAPRLRLSPYAAKAARSEVDLIDVAKFADGCDPGDTEAHFGHLVAGDAGAHEVACLAATASGATAAAVLEGAPLTDPDPMRARRLRRNAASVLVGLGPSAVDALCPLLGDPRDEARGLAEVTLGMMDAPEAMACARQALATGAPEARAAAAAALRRQIAHGRIGAQEAWSTVTGLLGDADAGGRIAGLALLPLFAADVSEPVARPLADDPDPAVAGAARSALGAIEKLRQLDALGGAGS